MDNPVSKQYTPWSEATLWCGLHSVVCTVCLWPFYEFPGKNGLTFTFGIFVSKFSGENTKNLGIKIKLLIDSDSKKHWWM